MSATNPLPEVSVPSVQPQPESSSDKREPLDRLYVYALAIESRPFEARLESRRTQKTGRTPNSTKGTLTVGYLDGQRVGIILTGAGLQRANDVLEDVLKQFRPTQIWSVGFAGALNPKLKKFRILSNLVPMNDASTGVIDISEDGTPETDPASARRIITVDQPVTTSEAKNQLWIETGADLVDMETSAVARLCAQHHIPLFCTRIVIDTADQTLPEDVSKLMDQTEIVGQISAALGSIFKKPSRVLDLMALKRDALEAAERLAQRLTED